MCKFVTEFCHDIGGQILLLDEVKYIPRGQPSGLASCSRSKRPRVQFPSHNPGGGSV